jgi:hypothetical protein
LDYQVNDNTFEQSAAFAQFNKMQMKKGPRYSFLRNPIRVGNHFINVNQGKHLSDPADMVMLRSR